MVTNSRLSRCKCPLGFRTGWRFPRGHGRFCPKPNLLLDSPGDATQTRLRGSGPGPRWAHALVLVVGQSWVWGLRGHRVGWAGLPCAPAPPLVPAPCRLPSGPGSGRCPRVVPTPHGSSSSPTLSQVQVQGHEQDAIRAPESLTAGSGPSCHRRPAQVPPVTEPVVRQRWLLWSAFSRGPGVRGPVDRGRKVNSQTAARFCLHGKGKQTSEGTRGVRSRKGTRRVPTAPPENPKASDGRSGRSSADSGFTCESLSPPGSE